ncbi:thioredoxin family protein [uncultured Sulfitobacter sp.]|uniref:DUF1223 domain-containing protein n=1 Tax=uncultured Sulfitobacter sp. TaxID=191468 RepID=UPI00260F31F1|nr:DUF1223 domain-containing protein [uncultured Sulfitobacter sp.]
MRRSSSFLTAALFSFCAGIAAPVFAEQRPVVVELFTSQGCSSCPPADALLSELSSRKDVIAIAVHVDYWDYIGWQDEFGDPAHAVRQRAYASKAGRRSVYTPEMVVNGQTDIVGAKPMALVEAIAAHKQDTPEMRLDVTRDGERVSITGTVPRSGPAAMEIHVLYVMPEHATKITKGENRGKTITYSNIAHDWQLASKWDGQSPLDLSLEMAGDDPVVVLVQAADGGPILAAARVD